MTNDQRATAYARQRGALRPDGLVAVPDLTGETFLVKPSLWNAPCWATTAQLRRLHKGFRKPPQGQRGAVLAVLGQDVAGTTRPRHMLDCTGLSCTIGL